MGRATQGVTLIAVEDGGKLSGLQRIAEADAEEDGAVADDGVADDAAPDDAAE